jgi:hypothetical protein
MPKETKFFDLFDRQIDNVVKGAKLFREIIEKPAVTADNIDKMHAIEHDGDEVSHRIIDKLNESFITPFDREDMLDLSNSTDNIIDAIYMITKRYYIYKLLTPGEYSHKFADLIEQSVLALQKVVHGLKHRKHSKEVMEQCVEINRLENMADILRDEAISTLLNDENANPIVVIKKKEMYETCENVTDLCEHTANIVESILVKNN